MTKKVLHALRYAPYAILALPATVSAATVNLGLDANVEQALGLGTQDVRVTIARIINVAMGLLGIIAVVIVLYGGFLWMTAAGNEDRVDKAQKMIVAGIIGLAIILSAYAIARFVVNSLVNATAG